jgi:cytochrome P450
MTLDQLVALDQDALRCPYPAYENLREEGVHFEDSVNAYVVSSNTLVTEVLRSPDRFSSANTVGNPVPPPGTPDDPAALKPLLLLSDDPVHAERRSVVARAFTPRQVGSWEEPVRKLVSERIASLKSLSDVDIVRDVSKPLPIRVITWVLGIPDEDVVRFREWSEVITNNVGAHAQDDESVVEKVRADFSAYLYDILKQRAADPKEDILTQVAQADLEEYMKVRFVAEMLVAGNITTTHHISSSVLLLAKHSGMLNRLREDRSLITRFVEESLRLESPIQGFYRLATQDTELGGVAIPEGSRVFVLYAGANHDSEMWGDSCPHIDLERTNGSQHLAFGVGAHTCLGAPLARLEGRLVVEAILDQVEDIELLVDPDEVTYAPSFINHGLATLPVRLTFR